MAWLGPVNGNRHNHDFAGEGYAAVKSRTEFILPSPAFTGGLLRLNEHIML